MTPHQRKTLFSSKSDEWETPQDLFDELNKEFKFTLDVCATKENAKCKKYFTKKQDGLRQGWGGHTVWCNPPYSQITEWVEKANIEFIVGNLCGCPPCEIVMLIPARTDTRWFHQYVYRKEGVEIRFIKGRLKFGNSKNSAPFPSMIVIWR